MGRLYRLVTVILFALVLLVAGIEAQAGQQWYVCSIVKVGQSGGKDYVQLTHVPTQGSPAFTARFFRLPAEKAKEMLAVALSAVTGGFKVEVYVDGQIEYSEVYAIYLVGEQ
jgi:hypothetical protein